MRSREAGFTLVELMITVGLSGLLALGLASVLTGSARQSMEAKVVADLDDEIDLFEYQLRSSVMTLTNIADCGCAVGTTTQSRCRWSGVDAAVGGFLLQGQVETNSDPTLRGPCASAADVRRGCKGNWAIVWSPPTVQVDAGGGNQRIGNAGVLSIWMNGQQLASLNGVSSLQCGFLSPSPTGFAPQGLRLFMRVKTRTATMPVGPPIDIQGWHPTDPGFALGIHRWLPLVLEPVNMSARGLIVAQPRSVLDCAADGATAPMGKCCSGYQVPNTGSDPPTGTCTAESVCIGPLGASISRAGLGGIAHECCTHQDVTGGGCARRTTLGPI